VAGRVQFDISGAHDAVTVDLSADTTLAPGVRGFTVGGQGNVKVDYVGGATGITLPSRLVGLDYAHQVSKIYSTANGTTATGIIVFY